MPKTIKFLDCTLRDGGYYNNWDFEPELVKDYLLAMDALQFDFVEIGFRSIKNNGFKGGCAYSTDAFINSLGMPAGLVDKIGVMINGSEISNPQTQTACLEQLFKPKAESPVTLVRIACHVHEFIDCIPAAAWLKQKGYLVGFNLMQVADRTPAEITQLAQAASGYPIDALYFADSMGSLSPQQVTEIIHSFQQGWEGELGIHTHDNMGQAIANSLQAIDSGVTWVDCTVTGMGRGPGNAQTEYLILALAKYQQPLSNPTKLFELIRKHFKPMQNSYGWGTNPFYYLAGQYGIHPTYIQEMLQDSRYSEEDVLAVINQLKIEGGKKFSPDTLEAARHFYSGEPRGTWEPQTLLKDKTVLILGTGPGVKKYQAEIQRFIEQSKPYVIALNTQSNIRQELIDARAACHPVRLLADCHEHLKLPQPLITPASMLPDDVRAELQNKELLDFGIAVTTKGFNFHKNYCELSTSAVIAYALAIASSGKAKQITLAGFDGYPNGDPRNEEMTELFKSYKESFNAVKLYSITPTNYQLPTKSIFGAIN